MPVRPESSKIVMIIFYLLLCTTYFFQRNFAKEKIFAIAVEIKVARYEAQKKYRLRQIAWKFWLRVMKHRKNIDFDK
jgi:hypothetical protein